ncbi:MAG TPA: methyltransferase domain-containing protein [Ktedonobacterales bacterium]|nr:methyltransferase domain-containing protein [Ktedonobacterales bacterium]
MISGPPDPWTQSVGWDDATARSHAERLDRRAGVPDFVAMRALVLRLAALQLGDTVVEVGCGTGPLLMALSHAVGPDGRAIGIEPQPAFVELARQRLAREGCSDRAEILQSSADRLDLPDASAAACIEQTVLLHLPPETVPRALAEMIRVTRPGGHVISVDQDTDTWIIDHPDRALTERLAHFGTAERVDGWMGRKLLRLYRDAGLRAVEIHPVVQMDTEPHSYLYTSAVRQAESARDNGTLTAEEASRWISQLADLAARGRFFASMNYYVCVGVKLA